MSNRVYTTTWNVTLGAASSQSLGFELQSVGREIKIKSITLSWLLQEQGTNLIKPWRSVTDQSIVFYVGGFPNKFSHAFANYTGPIPASTGYQIVITEPGQYLYDSFFIPNTLPLSIALSNLGAVGCAHTVAVTIETEEKTMFL